MQLVPSLWACVLASNLFMCRAESANLEDLAPKLWSLDFSVTKNEMTAATSSNATTTTSTAIKVTKSLNATTPFEVTTAPKQLDQVENYPAHFNFSTRKLDRSLDATNCSLSFVATEDPQTSLVDGRSNERDGTMAELVDEVREEEYLENGEDEAVDGVATDHHDFMVSKSKGGNVNVKIIMDGDDKPTVSTADSTPLMSPPNMTPPTEQIGDLNRRARPSAPDQKLGLLSPSHMEDEQEQRQQQYRQLLLLHQQSQDLLRLQRQPYQRLDQQAMQNQLEQVSIARMNSIFQQESVIQQTPPLLLVRPNAPWVQASPQMMYGVENPSSPRPNVIVVQALAPPAPPAPPTPPLPPIVGRTVVNLPSSIPPMYREPIIHHPPSQSTEFRDLDPPPQPPMMMPLEPHPPASMVAPPTIDDEQPIRRPPQLPRLPRVSTVTPQPLLPTKPDNPGYIGVPPPMPQVDGDFPEPPSFPKLPIYTPIPTPWQCGIECMVKKLKAQIPPTPTIMIPTPLPPVDIKKFLPRPTPTATPLPSKVLVPSLPRPPPAPPFHSHPVLPPPPPPRELGVPPPPAPKLPRNVASPLAPKCPPVAPHIPIPKCQQPQCAPQKMLECPKPKLPPSPPLDLSPVIQELLRLKRELEKPPQISPLPLVKLSDPVLLTPLPKPETPCSPQHDDRVPVPQPPPVGSSEVHLPAKCRTKDVSVKCKVGHDGKCGSKCGTMASKIAHVDGVVVVEDIDDCQDGKCASRLTSSKSFNPKRVLTSLRESKPNVVHQLSGGSGGRIPKRLRGQTLYQKQVPLVEESNTLVVGN